MVDDWELLDELRVAIGRKPRSLDDILSACATVLAETIAMASATEQETQSMLATVKSHLDAAVFFAAWYWQIDGRISAAASPAAWRCSPRMSRCSCQVSVGDTLPGSGRRLCHTCWRPALRSRKYFSTNSTSRAARGAPQTRQAISPSLVVSGPASPLTT